MLEFKKNDTASPIVLTLNELISLTDPYFLFVFKHVLTKDVVAFIKSPADDLSAFPDRYNKFSVNPAVLFANYQPGEWHYTVYEQASDTNLDPLNAGEILENGKLLLDRATAFQFTKYESGSSFKTYNG